MNKETILFVVGLTVLILMFCPIAVIWALTTLFPLTIPLTVKTWLAALILLLAIGGLRATINK